MRYLLTRLSPVVPLCFLASCATVDEQEVRLIQATPGIEKELGGVYPDAAVQRYVADIGKRTVRSAGREDLAWDFKVLDSPQINAFALPGGKVYITSGLLAKLEDQAQLASVISHEVAHVVRGHTLKQLQRVQSLQEGALMAAIVGGSGDAEAKAFIAGTRRYSRDQEREADLIALDYLARQGYDPRAILRTMEILEDACGGESAQSLATHPTLDLRRQYLQAEIQRRYAR